MTRFFGAFLHFVFRFSKVCHLKVTRFFGALLHFGFACPQFFFFKMTRFFGALLHFGFTCQRFVFSKWLEFLVRCCTSVSLFHSLSFENDWIFWCVAALRFRFSTICHLKMTGFFGALLHFGFACPQFIIWKWLDFLVRCCTSVSLVHSLLFQND